MFPLCIFRCPDYHNFKLKSSKNTQNFPNDRICSLKVPFTRDYSKHSFGHKTQNVHAKI